MKKFFTLTIIALVAFVAMDMVAPQAEALALQPLECTTAADYGWKHYGWSVLCMWAMQMENDYPWPYTKLDQNIDEGNTQIKGKTDVLQKEVYAVNTKKKQLTWYPSRT